MRTSDTNNLRLLGSNLAVGVSEWGRNHHRDLQTVWEHRHPLKQLLDEVPLLLVSRSRPDLIHVDVPEHCCETRSALS